jgi:hypothetical protein
LLVGQPDVSDLGQKASDASKLGKGRAKSQRKGRRMEPWRAVAELRCVCDVKRHHKIWLAALIPVYLTVKSLHICMFL